MKSKSCVYNCKITMGDQILHQNNYQSLNDIAKELGISYHIVSNIHIGRKPDKKWSNYKYKQNIEITRLNSTK